MKARILQYLVCPVDSGALSVNSAKQHDGEIVEGELRCHHGHTYAIHRGVPRMVIDQALEDAAKETQKSFSGKWKRIPNFGHEASSREMYVRWYLERYGFNTLDALRTFLGDKKFILDAGTGLGRDTVLYAENSDAEVFGIDLSESIDFANEHAGHLPNAHLIQADLTRLPFQRRFFDFIASDQVLHHTPDTESSFKNLTHYLSPGAQIAAYVYKKKGPIREFADDFLRAHYTEATEEECYEFSRAITGLGKALTDLKIEFEVPEDIPALEIKAGKHNLQRFIYWNVLKCYWNDALDLETNIMTNFDWYHPRYAHRHTAEEVRRWCAEEKLEIVNFDVVESGISVRARKA